jgi:hypothetical protein
MKCKFLLSAVALISMAVAPQFAFSQGPITVVEDFEGEFPGVITPINGDPNTAGYPNGFSFYGGANGPPTVLTQEILASGGAGGSTQAYRVSADAANEASGWGWYYGMAHFVGFYGEGFGFAGGQAGEDNPGNYTVSFDLKTVGNTSPTPITGDFVLYKGDYETLNNVDLNEDGDMTDGYDIYIKPISVPTSIDNYADYNRVTINLGTGAAPTAAVPNATDPNAPKTPITPFFDDESTILIRLYFNNSGFGSDDGNSFTLDNLALTFTPAVIQPGDFNESGGRVDGNDLLAWQRGEATGGLTNDELTVWKNNYGLPLPIASAVPEPATAGLLFGAVVALGLAARRRKA